jgi:hypothetical protein
MDKHNHSNRVAKVMAVVSVAMGSLLYGGGLALAAPVDPGGTGAAMGEVGDGIEAWVGTYAVPVIIALLLLGLGVALLIRFGKKSRNIV